MRRRSLATLSTIAVVVTSLPLSGAEPDACTFIRAARARFHTISPAEEMLLQRVAMAQIADYTLFTPQLDQRLLRAATSSRRPLESRCLTKTFLEQRRLTAELIQWMCVNQLAAGHVPSNRGIRITGAWITGKLDLQNTKLSFPLAFERCVFQDDIDLHDADIRSLSFSGTQTRTINGNGLCVAHDLIMRDGFEARGTIKLESAMIGGELELSNAHIVNKGGTAIDGYHLKVMGSLRMNREGNSWGSAGFRAEGQVNLPEASIGVNLDCKGGEFINLPNGIAGVPGIAFHGDGLVVGSTLFLSDGFKAYGEVRLIDASVNEGFSCCAAEMHNDKGLALLAPRIKIGGSALFYSRECGGFKGSGQVRLNGAKIGGDLNCSRSQFVCDNSEYAFDARGVTTGGSLIFEHAQVTRLNVSNANIGSDLNVSAASMSARHYPSNNKPIDNQWSLMADGIRVRGGAYFNRGCEADGGVMMRGASIGRNIDFSFSTLSTTAGPALSLDGTNIGGDALLQCLVVDQGPIMLQQVSIGGDLNCKGAKVTSLQKAAVGAQGMIVAGTVWFSHEFESRGQVDLHLALIRRDLRCTHGGFYPSAAQTTGGQVDPTFNGDGLKIEGDAYLDEGCDVWGSANLSNARVAGQLVWDAAVPTHVTVMKLRSARVGVLKDVVASWPTLPGSLDLEGFAYDRIDGDNDVDHRKSWLDRSRFSSQSYQQMADVFRKVGLTVEAKQILVASAQKRSETLRHKWSGEWLRYNVFGPLTAYGYFPLRAVRGAAYIVIFGMCVFGFGYWSGCIVPTAISASQSPSAYPQFNALVYSLDVFLPVIKLYQRDYWVPVVRTGAEWDKTIPSNQLTRRIRLAGKRIPMWLFSRCVRSWHWLQILIGWVLTTLVVAGLAGLIQT
jgi:hypothetical protein